MEKYGKVKCTFCIWFLEAQYQEVTGEWSCLVPPLFKYDITPWIKEGPDQQHAMDIGFMCIGRCIRPHKSCNRGSVIMGCCKYIQMEASQLHVYYIYIHIDLHTSKSHFERTLVSSWHKCATTTNHGEFCPKKHPRVLHPIPVVDFHFGMEDPHCARCFDHGTYCCIDVHMSAYIPNLMDFGDVPLPSASPSEC